MALLIRMVLYAVSMFVAGLGFATFDDGSGTLTINLEQLGAVLGGLVTFVATFIASRFSSKR